MITTSDAMKVMLTVQGCHPRTAPRMDDNEATLAIATIWAELFNEYRLELPDLIAGVKKRALSNREAPEPAEIIHQAREVRRDRNDRNPDRSHYEAICESKSDDAKELAANRSRLAALIKPIAEAKAIRR